MAQPPFSERYGLAPEPEAQPDDYLPPWVREAVTNTLETFTAKPPNHRLPHVDVYAIFRPYIWKVLERQPPTSPMGGPWAMYIPRTLLQCQWWQFYDILEEISGLIRREWGEEHVALLSSQVNSTLAKDGISWRLQNSGKVERALPKPITETIRHASALLSAPRLKGPDEQFQKAVTFLNQRPDPDEENCAKEAVGALEGVANIICGTTGVQLNNLLNRKPLRTLVPPTIRVALEKLYAFRGATPGVAHGQVGPAAIGMPEAVWVLGTAASSMVYLATKIPQ